MTDFVYNKLLLRSCKRQKCPAEFFKPCWLRLPRETGKPGISVHGHILSEIGLGRAVRLLVEALDSQSIPMSLTEIPLRGRQNEREMENRLGPPGAFKGSLTVGGLRSFDEASWAPCRRQFNIAYPFWELEFAPDSWKRSLETYDSFWAPSGFIRDMLCSVVAKPVHLIHQPLQLPDDSPSPRAPDGKFRCVTFLDFDSAVERKNPVAVLRAFQAAFPSSRKDVELVIKVRGTTDRGVRQVLSSAAAADPRVRMLDGTVSRDEIAVLLGSSDAFISLHRSEGFGFGCAEALAIGKAVIATDYSGTTDFITKETGYPVSWHPSPVPPESYFRIKGATWAEPDIGDAADKLRQVADDPDGAMRRALAGFRLLQKQHSIKAVSNRAAKLLKESGVI